MQEGLQENVKNMETRYFHISTFFYIFCVEFYFRFKDYRVFIVPHRLAASHLLY